VNTEKNTQTYFFALAPWKLGLMSFITFGFYELWWSFKNWLYISQSGTKKVLPFIRALFSLIFMYPLLKEIRTKGEELGYKKELSLFPIFLSWSLIFFGPTLLERMMLFPPLRSNSSLIETYKQCHVYFSYVSLFAFIPLLSAQRYINNLNLSVNPSCEINNQLTKGNWTAIAIGGTLHVLSIIGLLMP
jgi:hypothetical protein